MISISYQNSVNTELKLMINQLNFQKNFNPRNLVSEIIFFLNLNTKPSISSNKINKDIARKKLLYKLEYYKKNINNLKNHLKSKDCDNLEDFKEIIKNKLIDEFDIARGKKRKQTKRKQTKRKQTKRKK